jgi:hypothetical protein
MAHIEMLQHGFRRNRFIAIVLRQHYHLRQRDMMLRLNLVTKLCLVTSLA